MKRVIFYIDGFNLYFGLKQSGWKKYYWLDLDKLARMLINPYKEQFLEKVEYFTARISSPSDKAKRQNTYIEALETSTNIEIFYGRYFYNRITCKNCGSFYNKPSEKMTDVNIALNLFCDAYEKKYDIAYLISGDSDISPAIRRVKNYFPDKKIIVYFPPNRSSESLKTVCDSFRHLFHKTLKESQFPEEMTNEAGFIIKRPEEWK